MRDEKKKQLILLHQSFIFDAIPSPILVSELSFLIHVAVFNSKYSLTFSRSTKWLTERMNEK